ncbi:MAG: hypothetical protein Q9166_002322 [cf. Caloplaca sp. 2 TL-2023]
MANFDSFGEFLNVWENFGEPIALDDFGTCDQTSLQEPIAGKSSTYLAPDEVITPSQPSFDNCIDPRLGQFDVSQGGDNVQKFGVDGADWTQFDIPDFLKDDKLWRNIENGPSLANCETDQTVNQTAGSSPAPMFSDPWTPLPIASDIPYTDLSTQFPPHGSPQFAMSPPPVPLNTRPITGPSGAVQQTHHHSPGQAPAAMTYQNPGYTSDWAIPHQSFYPEAKTSRTRKRKAIILEDSDDDFADVAVDKRHKTDEGARKISLHQNVPRNVEATRGLHSRTETILKYDGSKFYDPLPHRPADWSIFTYTSEGELEPGTLYTPEEIQHYLYDHPLHTLANGSSSPKNGGLRLWIQRNPPDSKRRYPDPQQSNRCRFTNCFATHNVINQGHLRVCFDELSHLNNKYFKTDPFHNAGYVHLNCLERHLDFPQLCRDLPVLVDNRKMSREPGGKNRMALIHPSSLQIASQFLYACETQESLPGYPKGARPHQGSLTESLMRDKVRSELTLYQKQREERGELKGSHIMVHLGDLEVEFRTRDRTRKPKYQQPWKPQTWKGRGAPKGRKRRAVEESEDDEESE